MGVEEPDIQGARVGCVARAKLSQAGQQTGAKEIQFAGDFFEEFLCFHDGSDVGANADLDDIGKAQFLEAGDNLARCGQRAELTDERRCDGGIDSVAEPDGGDDLIDFGFVGDGGEGTADNTHATGDAFVLVDLGPA